MASSYSDSYKIELMDTGANANTWGTNTNNNLDVIDKFTAGYISKSVAGSADVTLTTANADPSTESANKVIELTGTLTGDIKVFIPAVENYYYIFNNTAGSHTLSIAPTGHASNAVPVTQGSHTIIYCKDGDDVVDIFANSLGTLSIKGSLSAHSTVMTAANGTINATAYSGDGSALTGVSSIPSGTTAMFFQGSAPSGWTQNTDASINTSTMRVVTGTGGGTGGSDAFASTFVSSKTTASGDISFTDTSGASAPSNFSAGATTVSTPQIASHTHTWVQGTFSPLRNQGVNSMNVPGGSASGSTGGGGSHSHSFSGSLAIGGSGTAPAVSLTVPAMNIKFANVIACSKD
tara:strand:+ start:6809 stop:7855 length:1047 start_codon:yes stop_codon:yes gene_type:complete